jgi:hypothetical protein
MRQRSSAGNRSEARVASVLSRRLSPSAHVPLPEGLDQRLLCMGQALSEPERAGEPAFAQVHPGAPAFPPSNFPVQLIRIPWTCSNRLLPFLDEHGIQIRTVVSDNGREFGGRPDKQPCESASTGPCSTSISVKGLKKYGKTPFTLLQAGIPRALKAVPSDSNPTMIRSPLTSHPRRGRLSDEYRARYHPSALE